jgi:hypothetical protein
MPFTKSEFLDVFERYNQATWPIGLVLAALAITAALAVVRQSRIRDRWASSVLGVLWLWSELAFHLAFFAEVNPVAIAFGLLFVVQGLVFLARAGWRHELTFQAQFRTPRGIVGLVVMTYAIAIYPLISAAVGHRWPHTPTFGAPCPVDLFTLGLLLWTKSPVPRLQLAIPLGWALVTSVVAWNFGMHEDWGLVAAAVVTAAWPGPRRQAQASRRAHVRPVTAIAHRVWKHESKT